MAEGDLDPYNQIQFKVLDVLIDLISSAVMQQLPLWCSWLSRESHILHMTQKGTSGTSQGREFDPPRRHFLHLFFFLGADNLLSWQMTIKTDIDSI